MSYFHFLTVCQSANWPNVSRTWYIHGSKSLILGSFEPYFSAHTSFLFTLFLFEWQEIDAIIALVMMDFVWVCIKLIISRLHNQHCFTCVKVTIVLQHYYAICKEICVVYATNCYLCCIAHECIYITKDLIIHFCQMFRLQLATFIILHCPTSSLMIMWATGC